jgi:hypothetical protein
VVFVQVTLTVVVLLNAVFNTPWLPKLRLFAAMVQFAVMVSVTTMLAVVCAWAESGKAPAVAKARVVAHKDKRFMKSPPRNTVALSDLHRKHGTSDTPARRDSVNF